MTTDHLPALRPIVWTARADGQPGEDGTLDGVQHFSYRSNPYRGGKPWVLYTTLPGKPTDCETPDACKEQAVALQRRLVARLLAVTTGAVGGA